MNRSKRPFVGIGIMVFKKGKVLFTKRKGSHGAREYGFPGGHMEFGESIIESAKREVLEETGVKIKNVKFLRLQNLKKYKGKHYVDIGLTAEWKSGVPKVLEPEKATKWQWYSLDNLPKPLFKTTKSYLEALKTGRNFFDA